MAQGVVAAGFDGVENGEAAAAEHFEIDAEAGVDHFCERHAFGEERARAGNQILHQANVPAVEAALERFATDLGDPGRDPQYGFGLIEARNTLRGLGMAK